MLDLIITTLSTWILFGVAEAGVSGAFRVTLGFFVAFFAPGYCLISVLLTDRDMNTVAKLGLSVGFSIILVAASGYILTYTPWELTDRPVFLTLSILTTCFSIGAFRRRQKASGLTVKSFIADAGRSQLTALRYIIVNRPITIVASIAVFFLVSVIIYSAQGVNPQPLTEFSVLSASGKASDYNTKLHVGQQVQYRVFVRNRENARTEYRLQLSPPDQAPVEIEKFTLENSAMTEVIVNFTPVASHELGKLQFLLYKNGDAAVYKTAYLLITITSQ